MTLIDVPGTIEAAIEWKGKQMAAMARKQVSWRLVGWGGAVALLAAPFIAMRVTSDVNWSPADFVVAGALLAVVGVGLELAVRTTRNAYYRAAVGLALLGGLLTIWVNLAVGIVGTEQNPANLWFFAALLVGLVGAGFARFKASGMQFATFLTAICLMLASAMATETAEFLGISLFALLFIASGLLFRRSCQS